MPDPNLNSSLSRSQTLSSYSIPLVLFLHYRTCRQFRSVLVTASFQIFILTPWYFCSVSSFLSQTSTCSCNRLVPNPHRCTPYLSSCFLITIPVLNFDPYLSSSSSQSSSYPILFSSRFLIPISNQDPSPSLSQSSFLYPIFLLSLFVIPVPPHWPKFVLIIVSFPVSILIPAQFFPISLTSLYRQFSSFRLHSCTCLVSVMIPSLA